MSMVTLPDRPALSAPRKWSPPAPQEATLSNGIRVVVHSDHRLPLVSLRYLVPAGSTLDGSDWGMAALTAAMLQESAGDLSSLERSAEFDRLAARFGVDAQREWTSFHLDLKREGLERALTLLTDAVTRPAFSKHDWDRVHRMHVTALEQDLDDNPTVASNASWRVLFGDEHPFGHAVSGTVDRASKVTLEQTRAFFDKHFHAQGAVVVIAGDLTLDDAITMLEPKLGQVAVKDREALVIEKSALTPTRWFLNSPGSTQTVIRVIGHGPKSDDDALLATELGKIALGGSFTSRLNQKLREEKGYTYGARAGIGGWRDLGIVTAYSNVRGDATAAALTDLLDVFRVASESGFTEDEFNKSKSQRMAELVDGVESLRHVTGTFSHEIMVGRPFDVIRSVSDRVQTIEPEALQEVTKRYYSPENLTIILVGDRDKVMPALLEAGFDGWQFRDLHGEVVDE